MTLPALTRALKLQEKAAKVGFDWNDVRGGAREAARGNRRGRSGTRATARPRRCRRRSAICCSPRRTWRVTSNVDPEAALRAANAKFERRFAHIEHRLAEGGRKPESADLDEMEALWVEAKERERRSR